MGLRTAVLLVIGSFAVGCGAAEQQQECGPNASCAEVRCDPLLDGRPLTRLSRTPQRELPPVVGSRRVSYSCGRDQVTMQTRRGIPASIAVFRGDWAYVSSEIPLRSADNPLQPYYFPNAARVPHRRCNARVLSGQVIYVGVESGRVALAPHGQFDVALDTKLQTPRVDGVPRLRSGQHVTVRALRCAGHKIRVARSISG
jgi:hypothetical protein